MAEPGRRRVAEAEEVTRLQSFAVDAANAFRDYIVGGDPARRQAFWTIYNQPFGGATVHDNTVFMTKLFEELDRIGRDSGVAPYLTAYTADRGRLFGFLWSNPVHFTDFIDTVFNIRTRLDSAAARDADVTRLSRQVRDSQGRPARADTQIGRIRAAMAADSTLTVEDAVRAEISRPGREETAQRYGEALTNEVLSRNPRQLAVRAAVALREFMLSGDESMRTTFRTIWDGNTSTAFVDAFTAEFTARIFRDTRSGLSAVAQAYQARHSGTDPNEFATMVTRLYASACSQTDNSREIETIRQAEGADVVDPLLEIVAKGMAGRAIVSLREVLETGNAASRERFTRILNGRLATVSGNAVTMPAVEQNNAFWTEFTRLYTNEISQNSRLARFVRSFQMNVLPIAIRDIFTELARATPDTARLNADYGSDLVQLVATNIGSLAWMARGDADLSSELTRRMRAEDPSAVRVSGIRLAQGVSRPAALRETYIALVRERTATRTIESPDVLSLLERNFDSLSYLAGTPADVQRELERRARARPPDAVAQQLLARFPANAGQSLSSAYTALRDARTRRAELVTRYGQEFVDMVAQNVDNLQWVMRPVGEIDSQMQTRRDDPFVRSINTTIAGGNGYSVGTLANGLRDIYAELGRPTPDRARLDQTYGTDLVMLVATNRASLSWLGRDLATVMRTLQDPSTDATTRALQLRLYGYTPVQLVSAIARTRSAITSRGLALADATDAFGMVFVDPVASRQAVSTPSNAPEAVEATRSNLVRRTTENRRQFEEIDRQLSRRELEPARALVQDQIRRWRVENDAIGLEAQRTFDPAALAALEQRQTALINSMLTPTDMRRAVEMAFAMVHLAETGGDMSRSPSLSDVSTTDQDLGTLRRLTEWYRGLAATGKQPVIGDIVSSVLYRADPNLYRFIGGLSENGFISALSRTYAMSRGRGGDTRETLAASFEEQFVSLVESLAPNLRMMESPSVMANPSTATIALRRAENELYASIVARVYRALASPTQSENRAAMVAIFGEEFVAAVAANQAQMSTLGSATAGLAEVRALPESVRSAINAAYPSAYQRSIGALIRTFRRQDTYMVRSMSAVYAVLQTRPPRGAPAEQAQAFTQRLAELNATYGDTFVTAVSENLEQLAFLQSPSVSPRNLASLPSEVRERLNLTFEAGPGISRSNFMANFLRVHEQLPRVYTQLRGALAFSNPTDTLPTTLANAIAYYRSQFGTNDYLFNQYINLDLLSRNIQRLARRYNIQIPPNIADGIDTPEELSQFLQTESGRSLLTAGRTFYDRMEMEYLQQRQDSNFHPTTGDYTDANVTALRGQLSILDALYLGVALESISGGDSSFQRSAATATMNAILVISNRDPYLVGPFLLQVLPAILSVSQDERTIVAAIEAFNGIFTQRYESGTRDIAYSNALNRRYFLEVFARIGQRLPEITASYDHNRLEDELRLTPEPRTDEGYMSPLLYRYRPGFWQGDGLEPLPTMYGQQGSPIRLLPRPTMPTSPFLPVPGGYTLDSGAQDIFSSMYDQLRPPTERMFRQRVPARFRIGTLGASTIIRRINQLFGPMPVDYNDYWLSAFGEAGGFYSHQERGPATTERGGIAGVGGGRTVTGGERGTARWTRDMTETSVPSGSTQTSTTQTTTDMVDVNVSAVRLPPPMSGPVPLPLFGIVPYDMFRMGEGSGSAYAARPQSEVQAELERRRRSGDSVVDDIYRLRPNGTAAALLEVYTGLLRTPPDRAGLETRYGREFVEVVASNQQYLNWVLAQSPDMGVGIHRARQQFHHESSSTRQTVAPAEGQTGDTTVTDAQTRGRTRGLLETYQRIARQSQTDMLLFVAGEHVPELASGGTTTQRGEDRLKSRLYFVTREGDVYQLAYGLDTRAQLLNYLYAGANTQQYLASARAVGRQMLTGDSAAAGFDGSAVGFTIPHSGGDSFSALALGQLVRNMRNMDPVHAEQAAGMAVTSLLADRRQRDVYAAFYRGAEIVTVDQQDRSRITDTRFSEGTGEVMWRRMRIDPMAYQAEIRAAGGYPTTAAIRGRVEWRPTRARTNALGVTAAYSHIDLLREMRATGADANEIYGGLQTILTSLYGWSEDTARDTGWLAAGSYMYARMENYTVMNPDGTYRTTESGPEGNPSQHFASAMFMYWAQRHGILMGAQRVPGWTRIYDRIDQAMRAIQQNPSNEAAILETLSRSLREDLRRDIWRFALAYGYDGERVRVYIVGGGQYVNDETAYGNLYSMFIFGRPARGYADILGHAYNYSPLVISEDASSTGFSVTRGRQTPFVDLYAGFGLMDWPNINLMRYQREITIENAPNASGALRAVYLEMGGVRDRDRLARSYGEPFVAVAEEGLGSLNWMVRPAAQVRVEMQTRLGEDNPVVQSFLNLRPGRDTGSREVRAEDAAALIDIFTELRKPSPNRDRLEQRYTRDLVDLVEINAADFEWLLLPSDRLQAEFARRAQTAGSIEARMAEVGVPAGPTNPSLTGQEVKVLMERNMLDVLVGATGADSRVGLNPDRYQVLLGSHLNDPNRPAARNERSTTYYILHTPVAANANARGSLVIGNEQDLDEWIRHGHQIGRGITRLEIARGTSGNYTFTFSGDRRLRALSAMRFIGGLTVPLRSSEFQVGSSWTVGGLVQAFQDHRLDILAGAVYGRREFGNERWDQWTMTISGRLQGQNTASVSEQWYGYIFFNQARRQVVFASNDVFNNADEMRQVCSQLGGASCANLSELSRTTGGAGLTWARTDVLTGNRLSFHFFFEGGVESYRPFSGSGTGTVDTGGGNTTQVGIQPRDNSFIFRTGLGFNYTRQSPNSTIPTIYSLSLSGQNGSFPLIPGDVTRPEYLQSYGTAMETAIPGWSVMGYGRIMW